MHNYYQKLRAQFGPFSIVPDSQTGRCLTREDSEILHRLQYNNSRGALTGCVAQAVRIMDQGRVLEPFRP